MKRVTVASLLVFAAVSPSSAQSFKFGVMSDTQWGVPDDGKNPNSVAVDIIKALNKQFIAKKVKFVVAVGDLRIRSATRTPAPLRSRYAAKQPFPKREGSPFTMGTNFSSPDPAKTKNLDWTGLSYAFDYNNARFVLLDQFSPLNAKEREKTDLTIDQRCPGSATRWPPGRRAGTPSCSATRA
jgi:hypothetical protein